MTFGIRLLRWSCGPGSRAGRVKGNSKVAQRVHDTLNVICGEEK